MFSSAIEKIFSAASSIPLDALVWTAIGGLFAVFLACAVLCFKKESFRARSKRPFSYLVNVLSAVVAALFLTENGVGESLTAAILFWCYGYLLYGALALFSERTKRKDAPLSKTALTAVPPTPPPPAPKSAPAVKNNVRLNHAAKITEKLLLKNLSKSDRQEVEKLKNTFAVLEIKGTLSPSESEILNDNFNTLLKLMAKYNV